MRAWTDVAVLARTKNMQGGFVAQSAAGLPFLLSEGLEAAFVPPVLDAPRRAQVTAVAPVDDRTAIVTFDAVEGIDMAEALVGCHCLVRRADLPEGALEAHAGAWDGWEVHDARTGLVGTVAGIQELPGQDLLEVVPAAGGRTVLVPLVDAFVSGIDEDARRIDVDLPDGLLDL